jgi:hypothetical protein
MKGRMKIQWLLPAAVVVGLSVVLLLCGQSSSPAAARAQSQIPADGQILIVPIQLERNSYGLAMVDTVNQTLWVYQLNIRGPAYNRLQLWAARSWQYDRLLQQYNTAEPKPQHVKILLEGFAGRLEEPESPERQDSNEYILQTPEPNSFESDSNQKDEDF